MMHFKLNKHFLRKIILNLVIILFVNILVYKFYNYTESQDVNYIFLTYKANCHNNIQYKYRLTEPGLSILQNITFCNLNKTSFYKYLIAIQVTLLLLLLLSLRSYSEKLYLLTFMLLFINIFDFYHIFKQHAATLLIVLAYSLKKNYLWIAGFILHNAGSLLTYLSLKSYESFRFIIGSMLAISTTVVALQYVPYASTTYGFIYQYGEGTYSLFLIKYFLFSAVICLFALMVTHNIRYFIPILFFLICPLGIYYIVYIYDNNQFAFRIFICIKGIMCPYILSQVLPKIRLNKKNSFV
jgi:hypothetical protein